MSDFTQGPCQIYVVDGEPTSDHKWNLYFSCMVRVVEPEEAAILSGPGVIIVHGHPSGMAQDIATSLTGKSIAVIVVSGAGAKAPESTDFASHPQLYYRTSNAINQSFGQCLMRFWKLCSDSNWTLPYRFELIEPPQLWDLVDDLSDARRDANDVMTEFRDRIELYRRVGITINNFPETTEYYVGHLDEVHSAAMLLCERPRDTSKLKWNFRINHNQLLKVIFYGESPWEVKAHLCALGSEDAKVTYREAMAKELEELRGAWQIHCEDFPDGRLFTGLKSFESKVETLLRLVEKLFTSDTDGECEGKEVVEAARDLIVHLKNFISNEPLN